jgi:hypothetical protein
MKARTILYLQKRKKTSVTKRYSLLHEGFRQYLKTYLQTKRSARWASAEYSAQPDQNINNTNSKLTAKTGKHFRRLGRAPALTQP